MISKKILCEVAIAGWILFTTNIEGGRVTAWSTYDTEAQCEIARTAGDRSRHMAFICVPDSDTARQLAK